MTDIKYYNWNKDWMIRDHRRLWGMLLALAEIVEASHETAGICIYCKGETDTHDCNLSGMIAEIKTHIEEHWSY